MAKSQCTVTAGADDGVSCADTAAFQSPDDCFGPSSVWAKVIPQPAKLPVVYVYGYTGTVQ